MFKSRHTIVPISRKFRLRTALVVPLTVQVVAAVGLFSYLSFSNSQRAVTNLATQLSESITNQINRHLENHLSKPHLIQSITASSIRNGNLNPDDFEQLKTQFWSDIQLSDAVDYIFLGDEEGQFIGVQNYPDGRTVVKFRDRETAPQRLVYQLDENGDRMKQLKSKEYDPRVRPWYITTLEVKQQTWSPIYASADLGALQITATTPIYDQRGEFRGILGSNFILSEVNKFLNELKISKSGKAFIIERSADLIATSTDEAPYLEIEGQEEPARLNAKDTQDPVLRIALESLLEQVGDLKRVTQSVSLVVEVNRERYRVEITPLRNVKDLDWLIAIAIPESDFMTEIKTNTRYTILLTIGSSIVAILCGIITSRAIVNPILRTADAARQLAGGQLNQKMKSSKIAELQTLANAFNSMAGQLKASFANLEDKVKERTSELARANQEIVGLNQRLKSENLRMGAELSVLQQMQQLILPKPKELEAIRDLDIAGFMEPADEVGGDYYDILLMDGTIAIGIGDVTGHGLESGILMVMTQTAVRTLQEVKEIDPVRFLDALNRTIYKNIARMNSDKNLTLAILNYADGKVTISGQHEEVLIARKDGKIERIDTMDLGLPIGLEGEIADFISHTSIELEPGDGIVLYTDGIPEARNPKREFYGIDRLCEIIQENWHLSAKQIEQAIIQDLRQYIDDQKIFDDITLVVIKRKFPQEITERPLAASTVDLSE
ncbi:MAG: SpoIIE family protein phosphatase [Cyanobacteriota bacterium]|nr:SpoIIE family protein phosphatase [Cyanobacteriota bacterium]